MAQQVEKLQGVAVRPNRGRRTAARSRKQWRGLNRAATFVACLTAPAVFLWMFNQHHARWWMAALGTLARDRRVPRPGRHHRAHASSRGRTSSAPRRRSCRRTSSRGAAPGTGAASTGSLGVRAPRVRRSSGSSRSSCTATPASRQHPRASPGHGSGRTSTAGAHAARPRSRSSILLFANVGILIGPFVLMAVRQIKSYEPGDASWGVEIDHVRGQAEVKEEITRDHRALAGQRPVQGGRRQARARPALHRLAGHRQDDAREGASRRASTRRS